MSPSFRKEVHDLVNGSIYVALTAEAKTKLGLSPSFVIYDELGSAGNRALFDAIDSADGGPREPAHACDLDTGSPRLRTNVPTRGLWAQLGAGDIRDPAFHLTLYRAPEDADPWSKKAWRAANPALGDFRSLADVERMAKQAQRMPARENAFRNLILNQRVAAEARFMDQAAWRACSGEPNIPAGARVYAGLDLGATRDLSALMIVWPDGDGVFHVKPFCWLPGDLKERSEQDHAPYDAWAKLGCITPIGATTDPKAIAHKIAELNGQNHITSLAFDRWRIKISSVSLTPSAAMCRWRPTVRATRTSARRSMLSSAWLFRGSCAMGRTLCSSGVQPTLSSPAIRPVGASLTRPNRPDVSTRWSRSPWRCRSRFLGPRSRSI